MIIESYDVKASSQRSFMSINSTTMTATRETRAGAGAQAERNAEGTRETEDRASISDKVKEMHKNIMSDSKKRLADATKMKSVAKSQKSSSKMPTTPEELKSRLLEMMMELLTGKKSNFKMQTPNDTEQRRHNQDMPGFAGGQGNREQVVDGWRFENFRYESEKVAYQAQGVVKTADGRTINIDINMYMSREFVSYTSINVEAQKPIDPLVINYGGKATSLTNEKFDFDLDMDGNTERLAVLGEGSGFLAVDWNNDGKINDGSELFGPSSGSGFSELRKHDKDGNNWIDEADEIFSKLVVWSRDKDGNDQMFTLKELGVGAIFLGDVATEFSFKGDSNETLGVMRSTSFFLNENGGGGTLSHVDLMI